MQLLSESPFLRHFSVIKDPRKPRRRIHLLNDMFAIAIIATILGIEDYCGMADFAKVRLKWLKGFLQLPAGAPSHDTFSKLFRHLDSEKFQECFINWTSEVATLTGGEIVAIDGKTLRRSFDKAESKSAIHMVSAWATDNSVSLGQTKVSEKSNEITAIPKLIEMLTLKGCIVTIDAMGCQRDICKKIVEEEANYTIALKKNQDRLHSEVKAKFDGSEINAETNDFYTTGIKSRSREVEYHSVVISDIDDIVKRHDWPGLKSIGVIQTIRTVGEEPTVEFRYYLNSHVPSAKDFCSIVRKHWQVENNLHWVLDVTFGDDACRVRKGNGAENLSTLKRAAINMLKKDQTKRRTM